MVSDRDGDLPSSELTKQVVVNLALTPCLLGLRVLCSY